ncbi:hypothetical protein ACFXPS_33365 [Nocardia sp. NPDC059091]
MPSVLHEVVIDLFRHRPQLVAELLPLVTDIPLTRIRPSATGIR